MIANPGKDAALERFSRNEGGHKLLLPYKSRRSIQKSIQGKKESALKLRVRANRFNKRKRSGRFHEEV